MVWLDRESVICLLTLFSSSYKKNSVVNVQCNEHKKFQLTTVPTNTNYENRIIKVVP